MSNPVFAAGGGGGGAPAPEPDGDEGLVVGAVVGEGDEGEDAAPFCGATLTSSPTSDAGLFAADADSDGAPDDVPSPEPSMVPVHAVTKDARASVATEATRKRSRERAVCMDRASCATRSLGQASQCAATSAPSVRAQRALGISECLDQRDDVDPTLV